MKKISFMLLSCLLSASLFAQEVIDNDVIDGIEKEKKNIIKVNLPALALKNISVQYERKVAKKISVAGTFRYMPKGDIPFKKAFIEAGDDPDFERQINNLEIGNMAFMPEVRFYVGKHGAMRGFYFAPFASIARYSSNILFEYDDNGTTETIPMTGDVNSFTGGLMLGAQWKLSKSVSLDWWILGPNYGKSKGELVGRKTLTPAEQQDLRDELASLDIPLTEFTYDVNAQGATVNFDGPWAGVRAGICIGINF